MINLLSKLNRKIYLACSGGVDSMAALHFLSRNHQVHVLHFNHGTTYGEAAMKHVVEYCTEHEIDYSVGHIHSTRELRESLEEYWRRERYTFFESFTDSQIITCHTLDDCVENWIWTSLNGCPKLIPQFRDNFVRPFLTTRKDEFISWANRNNLKWIEDMSNYDTRFTRNYIRHKLIPHALNVNPGLYKTIKKRVENAS